MLEGTDLSSAYQQSLVGGSGFASNSFDNSYASFLGEEQHEDEKPVVQQPVSQKQKLQIAETRQQPQQARQQQNYTEQPSQNIDFNQHYQQQHQQQYDANMFNKQYEQEQRLVKAINQLKKKKEEYTNVQNGYSQQSYFDKLFGKKKEVFRLLQAALIIVLGLSIYYLLDHYLSTYISEHDLSFERQLFIRLLYPFSILFILWNLRVFVK